ncbi:MAG: Bacterial transferase hexapeptide (Six repeats) [Promethearchaeota archaeon]|nr:MAG: Bacterial transferase hexapeptide (Six repeats) [Candidatus Lokiarchaeota archaeon]
MPQDNKNGEIKSKRVIKEEIDLQFHWYLLMFFTIYLFSWFFPGILYFGFFALFYYPYFLSLKDFILIFTQIESILVVFFFPVVLIIGYLIHIFLVGLVSRWYWNISENIEPTQKGIIPRNIPSRKLNFYHLRSFLIKYPKNAVTRGPFPWLINWLYNFVGTNKIGKNTTIEEQFGADRFVEIGDNCYIGVNSGFSSHSVEGIFGNIAYYPIKLGDNVTTAALNCLAPGVEIKDNSFLFPLAGATKHSTLKGDNYYFGVPLRKIYSRKLKKYLKVSKDKLKEAEELYNPSE